MVTTNLPASNHPLAEFIKRLEKKQALLKDSPENVLEVVGILKSYGVVLDAYSDNLIYIAEHQFLVLFPFFKYFNGEISLKKLFSHWWHDRINFEYAEYCAKTMFWHGAEDLDTYIESQEFKDVTEALVQTKWHNNWLMLGVHKVFPQFLPEQMRFMAYYTALGQFWRVMADMFLSLSDRYDRGEIKTIPEVVEHILNGFVS